MAILPVAYGSTGTSVPGLTLNTLGANLIVIYSAGYKPNLSSSTVGPDDPLNAYTALTRRESTNFNSGRLYYVLNPATSATHHFEPGNAIDGIIVAAFSGVRAYAAENGAGTGGAATALNSGVVTPLEDGALVFAGIGVNSGSILEGSALAILETLVTVGGEHMGACAAYQIQGTAAAIEAQWSWADSEEAATGIAVFLPEATPPADWFSGTQIVGPRVARYQAIPSGLTPPERPE